MRLTMLLLMGILGCSSERKVSGSMNLDAPSGYASDTGEVPADDGSEASEQASHWILSGSLTQSGGVLSNDFSSLSIEIRSDSGAVLCSDGVGITASQRITELPDADLQVWWEVRIAAASEGSCLAGELEGVIGGTIWVGLGPLHPEIEAVMSESAATLQSGGYELRSVFAAFEETQPVWVFGVAMSSSTDRDVGDSAGLILPDGQWKFEGVYSFPY